MARTLRTRAARAAACRHFNRIKHMKTLTKSTRRAATQAARAPYFSLTKPILFRGTDFKQSADEPFAYRYYDKNRKVMGKRMEEHLRLAVCYWHSFCWNGTDIFGSGTFARPWLARGPAKKTAAPQ